MDEYICRKATLKAFKLIAENPNKDYQRGMQDTIDCLVPKVIEDIPAADVQPVDRWISVKDRLPEIGKSVLIYYPYWDGDEIQVAKLEDEMTFDVCGEFNIRVESVTHWMPFPEPPKDGDVE